MWSVLQTGCWLVGVQMRSVLYHTWPLVVHKTSSWEVAPWTHHQNPLRFVWKQTVLHSIIGCFASKVLRNTGPLRTLLFLTVSQPKAGLFAWHGIGILGTKINTSLLQDITAFTPMARSYIKLKRSSRRRSSSSSRAMLGRRWGGRHDMGGRKDINWRERKRTMQKPCDNQWIECNSTLHDEVRGQ